MTEVRSLDQERLPDLTFPMKSLLNSIDQCSTEVMWVHAKRYDFHSSKVQESVYNTNEEIRNCLLVDRIFIIF